MTGPIYTQEQIAWLREQYRVLPLPDLTAAYNAAGFTPQRSINSIRACINNHGITSGRDGRFVKGQNSWNAGKRGYMGANATSFKHGDQPANLKPLWSERVGKGNLIEMKVPERNPYTGAATRYKHKHVWLWEQAHGPAPKGHAIIFADGNTRNFALDNLLLVTRAELLAINQHGYREYPDELKPSVLALARVELKAGYRSSPSHGGKRWARAKQEVSL